MSNAENSIITDAATIEVPSGLIKNHVKVGMLAFLLSEVAFFSTLITTYVVFLRETKDSVPSPATVFHLPLVLFATACLFSSSFTIHLAEKAMHRGERSGFLGWWGLTILLGLTFLACTAKEWHELIFTYGLTISRNMFGSAYFTLVGFHAACDRGIDFAVDRMGAGISGEDFSAARDRYGSDLVVLAFCRWRVGGCRDVGLFYWAVRKQLATSD